MSRADHTGRQSSVGQADDGLEDLADVSDELQLIADSDARYAKYAEQFLERLREAGYDV